MARGCIVQLMAIYYLNPSYPNKHTQFRKTIPVYPLLNKQSLLSFFAIVQNDKVFIAAWDL